MTPDEIRQLTGLALDREVEMVSGLRLWRSEIDNRWYVQKPNKLCGEFDIEQDARDFIAALLLREAERRGLTYRVGNGFCGMGGRNAELLPFVGEGTFHEAISRAFLLAAGEGT